ncbi:MAG: DUF1285 domain-containing protein [Parvibaculales bacterium]
MTGEPANFQTVLKSIQAVDQSTGLPPVEDWNPPYCGDIGLEIRRDGQWFYQGSPIGRKKLVKLFSSILRHDDDGQYYVVTPVEKILVTVEDAPFLVTQMSVSGTDKEQILEFTTLTDDVLRAGASNPLRVEINPDNQEPTPYVRVRGRLDALIARPVFYRLVDLCVEETIDNVEQFGVWSDGVFFAIAPAQDVGL